MSNIYIDKQLNCVKRELALRYSVYPGFIQKGRMTREEADYEIDCMTAVKKTLESIIIEKEKIIQINMFEDTSELPKCQK